MPLNPKQLVAVIGAVMVVIGSFLDWVTVTTGFGDIGVGGMEGDGKLTVAFGGLALLALLALLLKPTSGGATLALILLLIAGVVLAIGYSNVSDSVNSVESDIARASVGIGLYVGVVGAVLGVIGSIAWLKSLGKTTTQTTTSTPLPPPALA